jgi:AmmeMemoRadiSam system protein A
MENLYLKLAKEAVETFIRENKVIEPKADLPEELLKKRAGVFVTIKKEGSLRGCIGTYLPTKENVAKEIINNAILAATQDDRFLPIQKGEIPYLEYVVYILEEPEPIKDLSELDPKKYGIIVRALPIKNSKNVFFDGKTPPKTGLLLPNLEGVETKEKQLFYACQKAGIDPEKEKIMIFRFRAKKYE